MDATLKRRFDEGITEIIRLSSAAFTDMIGNDDADVHAHLEMLRDYYTGFHEDVYAPFVIEEERDLERLVGDTFISGLDDISQYYSRSGYITTYSTKKDTGSSSGIFSAYTRVKGSESLMEKIFRRFFVGKESDDVGGVTVLIQDPGSPLNSDYQSLINNPASLRDFLIENREVIETLQSKQPRLDTGSFEDVFKEFLRVYNRLTDMRISYNRIMHRLDSFGDLTKHKTKQSLLRYLKTEKDILLVDEKLADSLGNIRQYLDSADDELLKDATFLSKVDPQGLRSSLISLRSELDFLEAYSPQTIFIEEDKTEIIGFFRENNAIIESYACPNRLDISAINDLDENSLRNQFIKWYNDHIEPADILSALRFARNFQRDFATRIRYTGEITARETANDSEITLMNRNFVVKRPNNATHPLSENSYDVYLVAYKDANIASRNYLNLFLGKQTTEGASLETPKLGKFNGGLVDHKQKGKFFVAIRDNAIVLIRQNSGSNDDYLKDSSEIAISVMDKYDSERKKPDIEYNDLFPTHAELIGTDLSIRRASVDTEMMVNMFSIDTLRAPFIHGNDYIFYPKRNLYRSIHFILEDGREVKIRTRKMDYDAESQERIAHHDYISARRSDLSREIRDVVAEAVKKSSLTLRRGGARGRSSTLQERTIDKRLRKIDEYIDSSYQLALKNVEDHILKRFDNILAGYLLKSDRPYESSDRLEPELDELHIFFERYKMMIGDDSRFSDFKQRFNSILIDAIRSYDDNHEQVPSINYTNLNALRNFRKFASFVIGHGLVEDNSEDWIKYAFFKYSVEFAKLFIQSPNPEKNVLGIGMFYYAMNYEDRYHPHSSSFAEARAGLIVDMKEVFSRKFRIDDGRLIEVLPRCRNRRTPNYELLDQVVKFDEQIYRGPDYKFETSRVYGMITKGLTELGVGPIVGDRIIQLFKSQYLRNRG